jgi:hypothetical protein
VLPDEQAVQSATSMARANGPIIAGNQSDTVFGETPLFCAWNGFTAYFGSFFYKYID